MSEANLELVRPAVEDDFPLEDPIPSGEDFVDPGDPPSGEDCGEDFVDEDPAVDSGEDFPDDDDEESSATRPRPVRQPSARAIVGAWAAIPLELIMDHSIKPNELRVYAAIKYHQGQKDSAWPSVVTLAAETGIPRGRISKHTGELVNKGWLKRTRTLKGNVYEAFDAVSDVRQTRDVRENGDVPEVPDEGRPANPGQGTSGKARTKKTPSKTPGKTSEEAGPSAPAPPPSRKDPYQQAVATACHQRLPHDQWGDWKRTGPALTDVGKRLESLMAREEVAAIFTDPEEIAEAIAQTFESMRQKFDGKPWWAGAPCSPLGLQKHWEEVVTTLSDRIRERQRWGADPEAAT